MQTRFPILRAELASPTTTLPLQPYFLAQAAVRLLGFEPDTRRFRVAVHCCESQLQSHYIQVPLHGSKPARELSEQEIASVHEISLQITREWREVRDYFRDPGPGHSAHFPLELRGFLAAVEEVPVTRTPRKRASELAERTAVHI